MRFVCLTGCTVAAFALLPSVAVAQTATDSFDVTITIEAECVINSAEDMDFGTVGVLATAVTATSTIDVVCTEGSDFNIGLDDGLTGTAPDARIMTSTTGDTVSYALYQDAGAGTIWGDTIGADTLADTGTGTEQTYTVFGVVPPQPTPPAGTYTDTVGVIVSF